MKENHEYDDIIELKRPVSARAHMTIEERAAQFSSFAALTGYNDVIDETARITDGRIELNEDKKADLERVLKGIIGIPYGEREAVTVTFYVPDGYKSGGSYNTITGVIKKIDMNGKSIIMDSGKVIDADSIVSID